MGKVKQLAVFLLVGTTILLSQNPRQIPYFKVDPLWPKPLPNHWLVGAVAVWLSIPRITCGLFIVPQRFNRMKYAGRTAERPPSLNSIQRETLSPHGAVPETGTSGRSLSTASMLIRRTTCGLPGRERRITRS